MSKTLVNILYEGYPITNYLFNKTLFEEGDRFLFITTHNQKKEAGRFQRLLQIPAESVSSIVLEYNGDEYVWDKMCRTIRKQLDPTTHYCVNLAGGTRFMSLSVQQVFSEFDADFYYVPLGKNFIAHSKIDNENDNNDDEFIPITHRMSVREYLSLCGIEMSEGEQPSQSPAFTYAFFDKHVNGTFSKRDREIVSVLRQNYRKLNYVKFDNLVHPTNARNEAIPDIRSYIKRTELFTETAGQLSMAEVVYLTGGWFEELVYNWVKENLNPDDVRLTVHIARQEATFQNELDVVFTKGNHLFVVECKTGISGEGMFHDIVYKVCALKDAHLGQACHSYIVSMIKDESGQLVKTAKNMDVVFCDYTVLASPTLRKRFETEVKTITGEK